MNEPHKPSVDRRVEAIGAGGLVGLVTLLVLIPQFTSRRVPAIVAVAVAFLAVLVGYLVRILPAPQEVPRSRFVVRRITALVIVCLAVGVSLSKSKAKGCQANDAEVIADSSTPDSQASTECIATLDPKTREPKETEPFASPTSATDTTQAGHATTTLGGIKDKGTGQRLCRLLASMGCQISGKDSLPYFADIPTNVGPSLDSLLKLIPKVDSAGQIDQLLPSRRSNVLGDFIKCMAAVPLCQAAGVLGVLGMGTGSEEGAKALTDNATRVGTQSDAAGRLQEAISSLKKGEQDAEKLHDAAARLLLSAPPDLKVAFQKYLGADEQHSDPKWRAIRTAATKGNIDLIVNILVSTVGWANNCEIKDSVDEQLKIVLAYANPTMNRLHQLVRDTVRESTRCSEKKS